MARVGRPRTKIDMQEWFAFFAKQEATDRRFALTVMEAVDEGLRSREGTVVEEVVAGDETDGTL